VRRKARHLFARANAESRAYRDLRAALDAIHVVEHLEGHLLLEHLTPAQRKTAMRILRDRQVTDARPRRSDSITIDPDGGIVDD